MEGFLNDLRYGVRGLQRMRGAALIAILTLAVGVGATTAIFGVVYAALLRPLPFAEAHRLVVLNTTRTTSRSGTQRLRWSHPEIAALESQVTSLAELASFTQARVNLTGNGDPEQIFGEIVSPAYLRLLRIAPLKGRTFLPGEDTTEGGHPVALISARLWRARFGSDPAVLGGSVGINQVPLTIVGVLPDTFSGLSGRADVWIPTTMAPRLTYGDYVTTPQHFINVVGRLKPGISVSRASGELSALAPHVVVPEATTGSERVTWSALMRPLADARIDPSVRRSGLLLVGAVACVLVISCVNVASVLFARARTRRREIAVRLALGSTRARIVRQLLTESLVLAGIGGALGTLLAIWGVAAASLPAVIASSRNDYGQLSGFATPSVDGVVLLFALVVTLGTSILFGLTPALETSRPDLVVALKEDSRTAAGGRQFHVLGGLVVTEVAVAVLLLTGAGLLLKSFAHLQEMRVGFVPEGVVTFSVNPPPSRYRPSDGPAVIERLLMSVEQVPGVAAATVNRCAPFTGCARTVVFFPEHPTDAAHAPAVGRHYVSADYFRTLGIPLRAGRALTNQDREGRPPVAVINEAAARRFWPGESPIGRHVWFGSGTGFTDSNRPVEIVGIVGDVKYGSVDDDAGPDFYTSYLQFAYPDTLVIVKTDRSMGLLIPALRHAVAAVDAGLPIFDVQTLDDRIAQALARPRFNAAVLICFAGAAVLLATVGVYGVMSYSVSFRLHEIGVRLALGADARRVLALVLGQGVRLAGTGAAVGVAAALALTRLMRSLLFGVSPTDPAILSAVAVVIVAAALVAAFVPARRASSVDPLTVLRSE